MEQSRQSPAQTRTLERPAKLLNQNFVLLWQGQAVSQVGTHVHSIAMTFLVKHATGSASLLGLIMMVEGIPRVLLSGIGGTFADRYSRRMIIVCSDIFRGLLVFLLAGLLYMRPHITGVILGLLVGMAFCYSVTEAFFGPAISAAVPDIVPQDQLAKANSLRRLTMQLAMFMGRGLGGMLFRLWGAPLLVLMNGFTFLFSAASEYFIAIPQHFPEKSRTWKEQCRVFGQETVEGFRSIWNVPGRRTLVFVTAFTRFFTMPIIVTLPFYVEDFLRIRLDWYGFFLVIYGIGIALGALSAGFVKLTGQVRGKMVMVFVVLSSFLVAMLGFVSNLFLVVVLVLMLGVLGGLTSVITSTILQMSTPSEIRGRVFGFMTTLAAGVGPLGMGLGGMIFDWTGQNIPLLYGGCGGLMALFSILVLRHRAYREFLTYEPVHEAA